MSDIAGFLTAKQWGVAIFVAFLSLVGVIHVSPPPGIRSSGSG